MAAMLEVRKIDVAAVEAATDATWVSLSEK